MTISKKIKVNEVEANTLSTTGDFEVDGLTLKKLNLRTDDGTLIPLDTDQEAKMFTRPNSASGSQSYTGAGTYSFSVPAGVYNVSAVAIGGGGAGQDGWASPAGGGAGLGWANNISVTPGGSVTVVVGSGGTSTSSGNQSQMKGGTSYVISTSTVAGFGGGNNSGGNCYAEGPNKNNNTGGGYQGDGGGAGGHCSNYQGGAGCGGYEGTGGAGNASYEPNTKGAHGGGYYSSTYGTGAGGGCGLSGINPSPQGFYTPWTGVTSNSGSGGGGTGNHGGSVGYYGENPWSGTGQSSNNNLGGTHGGGGGGPGTSWPNASGNGGVGGVRLVWGTPASPKSYPSNAT